MKNWDGTRREVPVMIQTGWSKAMGIKNEKSGRNKAVDVKKCEN